MYLWINKKYALLIELINAYTEGIMERNVILTELQKAMICCDLILADSRFMFKENNKWE